MNPGNIVVLKFTKLRCACWQNPGLPKGYLCSLQGLALLDLIARFVARNF